MDLLDQLTIGLSRYLIYSLSKVLCYAMGLLWLHSNCNTSLGVSKNFSRKTWQPSTVLPF